MIDSETKPNTSSFSLREMKTHVVKGYDQLKTRVRNLFNPEQKYGGSPEQEAEKTAREIVNLFALAEVQRPLRTLYANEQNEISLTDEPPGTIYRLRIEKRHTSTSNPKDDLEDFSPMWIVSTQINGEWFFFQFWSKKRSGDYREFHMAAQNLSAIKIAKAELPVTEFKISEAEKAFPDLAFFESPVKGIDIMQFGTPEKKRLSTQDKTQTADRRGFVPGLITT